jgi:hypothetical protein
MGGGNLFWGCNSTKFIKSDIEKDDTIKGILALCWRAQKDNSATGGGNTRNCDDIQAEYLRQERFNICFDAKKDKQKCYCEIWRGCVSE